MNLLVFWDVVETSSVEDVLPEHHPWVRVKLGVGVSDAPICQVMMLFVNSEIKLENSLSWYVNVEYSGLCFSTFLLIRLLTIPKVNCLILRDGSGNISKSNKPQRIITLSATHKPGKVSWLGAGKTGLDGSERLLGSSPWCLLAWPRGVASVLHWFWFPTKQSNNGALVWFGFERLMVYVY